jgi:leucyl aminopeptidase
MMFTAALTGLHYCCCITASCCAIQIVKLGMGAYMGVTQGSVFPPKFIHITYKPKGEVTRRVALVGKVCSVYF